MSCDLKIIRVTAKAPDCPPGQNPGIIEIRATSTSKDIEYSIDGGTTWYNTAVFSKLLPGDYEVSVRIKNNYDCFVKYGKVTVPFPPCSCSSAENPCGSTLFPGDLAIIGIDNHIEKRGAGISIAILNEILPNTAFTIAFTVYEAGADAGVLTDKWYAGAGDFTSKIASQRILYKGNTTISPGSVLCFDLPQEGVGNALLANYFRLNGQPTYAFCAVNNGNSGNPHIECSTKLPVSLFLMQGDWNFDFAYATFCGSVLAGFQDGEKWVLLQYANAKNSRRSRLHPHISLFAIQNSTGPHSYAAWYPASGSYTPATFLEAVSNFGLWKQGGTYGDELAGGCGTVVSLSG